MSKSTKGEEILTTESVDLNVLIKFIGTFDGNREKLNAFLNNCRNSISLANAAQKDIIFKYILSRLEGRAETACSIKEFAQWSQLEEFLKTQFGERKHYTHLLSDLQECKQKLNESVNQFGLRVETCLAKLLTELNISLPAAKKSELTGRVAAMQDLALHTFINGLHPQLSMLVRCRDPDTLNNALTIAVAEEKILHSINKKYVPFSFSPNQSRPNPSTSFSRGTTLPRSGNEDKPNFMGHSSSSSTNPFCRYCKTQGHLIENCQKREYNNNRFRSNQSQQNNSNSYRNNFQQNRSPRYPNQSRVHFVDESQDTNVEENWEESADTVDDNSDPSFQSPLNE